jgi:hypothetical protein
MTSSAAVEGSGRRVDVDPMPFASERWPAGSDRWGVAMLRMLSIGTARGSAGARMGDGYSRTIEIESYGHKNHGGECPN